MVSHMQSPDNPPPLSDTTNYFLEAGNRQKKNQLLWQGIIKKMAQALTYLSKKKTQIADWTLTR
jgi:hypothetical protein